MHLCRDICRSGSEPAEPSAEKNVETWHDLRQSSDTFRNFHFCDDDCTPRKISISESETSIEIDVEAWHDMQNSSDMSNFIEPDINITTETGFLLSSTACSKTIDWSDTIQTCYFRDIPIAPKTEEIESLPTPAPHTPLRRKSAKDNQHQANSLLKTSPLSAESSDFVYNHDFGCGSMPPLVTRGKRGQLAYDADLLDERTRKRLLANRISAQHARERQLERNQQQHQELEHLKAQNVELRSQLNVVLQIIEECCHPPALTPGMLPSAGLDSNDKIGREPGAGGAPAVVGHW